MNKQEIKNMKFFYNFINSNNKGILEKAETDLQTKKKNVLNLQKELKKSYLKVVEAEKKLNILKNEEGMDKKIEEIRNNMAKLNKIPQVKKVEIGDDMVIYTEALYVDSFEDKKLSYLIDHDGNYNKYRSYSKEIMDRKYKWLIGEFKITVKNNYEIKFQNLTNKRKSIWGSRCNAPHVNLEGRACMGDLSEQVAKYKKSDLSMVCMSLVQFLQSVNLADSAGKKVFNWDLVDPNDNNKKIVAGG